MKIENMIEVTSSVLRKVGYEDGIFYALFNSGGFYRYFNVEENIFQNLLNTDSKEKYHHAYIKNKYHCRELSY